MAKKIFATDAEINEFLQYAQAKLIEESRNLKKIKFQNSQSEYVTLNFAIKEIRDERKATIKFSEKAWIKIFALVHTYATEVEWHGVVKRLTPDSFFVEDILIFPHEVTGTTVISDQATYEKWLNTLDNETFNSLRFHGHSHVNMRPTPSSTDMIYRKQILNNFGTPTDTTDFFYIFLIFNKQGEISGEVYDLQNNAIYSTEEINIATEEYAWLTDFLKEAEAMITERTYHYQDCDHEDSETKFTVYTSPSYDAKPEAQQISTSDYDAPSYGFGKYGGRR